MSDAFPEKDCERLTLLFSEITEAPDVAAMLEDRIADWASFMNLRLEDVEKAFVGGLVGEVSVMRRHGVRLSVTATPAERAHELLDQTAAAKGDFDRFGVTGGDLR